jgi:sulfoxide reductase catalytic subunit YedY
MLIKRKRGWEIPESSATPESVYLDRRNLLTAGTAALVALPATAVRAQRVDDDPSASLYPLRLNETYKLDRPVTPENINANHNNFYEFGTSKTIARAAQALRIRPWVITIDGMVEKKLEVGIDDLLKAMPLEERLYRMRCVEAWSMTIPWGGFPFKAFLDYVKPLSSAKFVRMETFYDPGMAFGQRSPGYPWPYVEGLTIEEAANELSFLVTGAYGKPAAKQFGAPIRLMTPWKYGFKAVKSIRKFTFTDKRPVGLWEELQPSEYGFWANVNPDVSHPRWSQATEEVLGTGMRIKTQIWNGYGEYVAGLYKGLEKERLFA